MPQVSVNDCAYIDARLRLAGKQLRINHERLGWRLLQVWSQVTARESLIMPTALVGATIGKPGDDVAQAFIAAQLAEPVGEDDSLLDLSPMQTMFGGCDWAPEEARAAEPLMPETKSEHVDDPEQVGKRGADVPPTIDDELDVELIPLERMESDTPDDDWEENPFEVPEPYILRYWILSNGETAEDVREALVCSHGPTSDENPCIGCKLKGFVKLEIPRRQAAMCAEHYHSTHEGEGIEWPLVIASKMYVRGRDRPLYEHTVTHEYLAEHDINLFNAIPVPMHEQIYRRSVGK